MQFKKFFFHGAFIGGLCLFLPSFFPSNAHSDLILYGKNKDGIVIEARDTDAQRLFSALGRNLRIEKIPLEGNEAPKIYLYGWALEDVVKEIIQIAGMKNYAIFYYSSLQGYLAKIVFVSRGEEEKMNGVNFIPKGKNLEGGNSLKFWLESLGDENLQNRKEALQVIANVLGPEEGNIFLYSLDPFVKGAYGKDGGFDDETITRLAEDLLREFFTGTPKPTYGR